MADGTDIEWARHPLTGRGATWNPVVGCSIESPGCINCYAMRLAATRLKRTPSRQGLTHWVKGFPVWTGEVRLVEEWLTQPLRWRAPRGIFVCAHGDLFAPGVPDAWIDRVFAVMALAPQHVFMVLTKRAERLREYLSAARAHPVGLEALGIVLDEVARNRKSRIGEGVVLQGDLAHLKVWPLPNVWLGVSVEDQRRAAERIPQLLDTPAAKRFISAEPLLGRVEIANYLSRLGGMPGLDWVIAGFESGPEARVAEAAPDIARSLRDQCAAAGVPFFFKQWGNWIFAPDGLGYHEAMRWAEIDRHGEPPFYRDEAWGHSGYGPPSRFERFADGRTAFFTSKAKAGRLLDGVEHNAMPEVENALA